jgi:hypothetical protein
VVHLQEPAKLAEEMARRDVKTLKEVATTLDVVTLEEALYIIQLRGLATLETMLKEGRLEARLCSLVQPLIRTYLDAFFKELGVRAKTVDEGACLRVEA